MGNLYRLTNTALEPSKANRVRIAPKLEMEPTIAGQRLRLRTSRILSQAQFDNNKAFLEKLEAQGVVSVVPLEVTSVPIPGVSTEPNRGGDMFPEEEEAAPQVEATPPPPPPPPAVEEKVPEIMGPSKLGTFPGMGPENRPKQQNQGKKK